MLKRMILLALCAALTAAVSSADEVPAMPVPSEGTVSTIVLSTDPADYELPVCEASFGLQQREAVEHSYFDDAVFIGDSISLKLYYYVKAQRKVNADFLGKAQFLVAGSLGSGNALWEVSSESVHPSYRGTKMLLEDSVAAVGAKKVYIMLGINDVTMYGVDGAVENMQTLIERILQKSPEAEIFVQSATPRIAAMKNKPTNEKLFEYDLKLYEMCVAQGWHFVDVASVMRDEKGNLPDAYCSDAPTMGMHFTDEACQVWVDFLLTHTPQEDAEVADEAAEDDAVEVISLEADAQSDEAGTDQPVDETVKE